MYGGALLYEKALAPWNPSTSPVPGARYAPLNAGISSLARGGAHLLAPVYAPRPLFLPFRRCVAPWRGRRRSPLSRPPSLWFCLANRGRMGRRIDREKV